MKSFNDTHPDAGCANAPLEDHRYDDGNAHDGDDVDDDVVRVVVVVDEEERVVVLVVDVARVVVEVVVPVLPPPEPVQVTVTGPELPLATKPKVVEAPAPSAPLYGAFRTVTVPELPVLTPFQRDCTVTPDGRVIETVQPLSEPALSARTVTPPWKPPGHEFAAA